MIYQYYPFTLTLKAPLIVAAIGGDPNSCKTLPYIPGSAIRGVLARTIGDPKEDLEKQNEFRNIILGGKVRYFNAYPLIESYRAVPMILSLRRNKDSKEKNGKIKEVFDISAYTEDWPKEQLDSFRDSFQTLGTNEIKIISPKIDAHTHHQRDPQKGRAWKDENGRTHGAIFVYEYLEAGQSFGGVIQVRSKKEENCKEIHEKYIKSKLNSNIMIGRSRRSEYGGMAQIVWSESTENEHTENDGGNYKLLINHNESIKKDSTFRVALTSGCILRNPQSGQIDPAIFETVMISRTGFKATCKGKCIGTTIIGGFNNKWKMPTPQAIALSAGSVFLFKAEEEISIETLRQIEQEGIGERKEEGYGRLVFLDNPVCKQEVIVYKSSIQYPTISDKDVPDPVIKVIERRIIEKQVHNRIKEEAVKIVQSATALPSNSLLGRLRLITCRNHEDALTILKNILKDGNENMKLKRPAMKQLGRCTVRPKDTSISFSDWIYSVASEGHILNNIAECYYLESADSAKGIIENNKKTIAVDLIKIVLSMMAVRNRVKEV